MLDDYRIGCLQFTDDEVNTLINLIGQSVSPSNFQRLSNLERLLREDPRIDDENRIITIDKREHLSYEERSQLIRRIGNVSENFIEYYQLKDEELIIKAKEFDIPMPPCYHHLALSIILSGDPLINFEGEIPKGIYNYLDATIRYMKEKGTYLRR